MDYKSFYYKNTCTRMFIAAQCTIAKTWNQPKCPSMLDWTGKMWHIYTMEFYAAIKNGEFVSFVGTWMKLETIILRRIENQTLHFLTHKWVLNNDNTQTQGGEHHTLVPRWGLREEEQGVGVLGRDSIRRNT